MKETLTLADRMVFRRVTLKVGFGPTPGKPGRVARIEAPGDTI
jgi:hypothetical protein